ncbi:sodium/bile acid cotransporter 7 [Novosphingobium sp. BK486]|nr:sodium/bile acid cotransporter 7 [Novosphingobium sp. BK256]MBB3373839.1 sodium/bile acid cotransporter 7 [Novosphingobium sp. BK280]MBB3378251.1 sodium/bile acid cotransporter 7 [Novosphingobium sp. BK258]MBB3419964.1 sodium/bile acid cotransporter 7 [Novosphingobium sp. BK267]MBB3447714.1 sodium/bile acid cotransporter 7 [Novosphingobium sp. BK352]MBB3477121.1 sodium/bile acid cotransporter 7 [Novosphingobium sp. BK369]MBB3500446.1 sodium/bile acid cotransporter 7 [Novosphingobium sp. BK
MQADIFGKDTPPMGKLRTLIDPYLLLLIGTIAIAAVFPAHGAGVAVADVAVTAAVALLFFLYGARLAPQAVWQGMAHWRLQALVFASTFALFPLIGLGVVHLIGGLVAPDIAVGLLFLCVLPSTVQSSIAFTSIARGNVPAALCSASLSNLVGVALTPVLTALLLPTSASGGFSAHSLETIAMQILLPFVAGQVARPFIGDWLARHKKIVSYVDRGSILLVVYAAFSAGMVAGVWTRLAPVDLLIVLVLDLLILALVIVATTLASRKLGFNTEDEITIVFCGSKKSMASGIPMATILFAGHAVSLIVLPLMLFHQAQLFVCATLARRYAARPES